MLRVHLYYGQLKYPESSNIIWLLWYLNNYFNIGIGESSETVDIERGAQRIRNSIEASLKYNPDHVLSFQKQPCRCT